ncbi:MAG: type II secretion system minor pseudopilin GspK [Burkholderiales bacterium]|nr:type II secretion system minor pseudopilin GspK [Burkholderiales bacterium]
MVSAKVKNRGAALITVMIVVFIIVAIITHLTVTNYRTVKRLSNRQLQEQASTIAFSAIDFGRAGLGTSAATLATDSLKDIWAQPLPKTKLFDEVYMSGYVIDEQSKFNLNDLVNTNGQPNQTVITQFSNLLSYINLPPGLAYNIAYYMAAPPYQSEIMNQYTTANPPSRPAGRPFIDISELILIKGVNSQIINKLQQYVTIIPVNNYNYKNESQTESSTSSGGNKQNSPGLSVNVNTAMPEVIAAKGGISLSVAQRIVSARQAKTFGSTGSVIAFLTENGITQNNKDDKSNLSGLVVSSKYFTTHAVVEDQDYTVKWVALVYRPNRSGQWPQILWLHPE